ncbi:hypothetical protein TorRG33x02_036260 [Trema orientale]|uniref:Uncharacterized protein n=1 Tax=Trema orientale TaxID=63057 RepID=A0A2P5FS06_TREOI|nr:hypothetical protein TorRG33x02_036260 [Trema orientale]
MLVFLLDRRPFRLQLSLSLSRLHSPLELLSKGLEQSTHFGVLERVVIRF